MIVSNAINHQPWSDDPDCILVALSELGSSNKAIDKRVDGRAADVSRRSE
jgi:hypothetical protein